MKKSLYRSFYKHFLLVMLLPTLILTVTLFFFNGYVLFQNMKAHSENTGTTLVKEMSYYTKQLNGCRNTLINESFSLNALSDQDSYSKFQLIRQLNGYKNILGYCRNIGIIDMQNEKAISSDGESSLSLFFDTSNHQFVQNAWTSMDSSSLIYPYYASNSVNFLYMAGQKQYPDTFLFFTLDSYHLYDTIADLLKSNGGSVLLENSATGEFYPLGNAANSPTFERYKQYALNFPENSSFSVRHTTLIQKFNFPPYDICFYVYTPSSSMRYTLLVILAISCGILLFSFFSGLLLVRYMAQANYTPIHEIKNLIPEDHLLKDGNELLQINHAIIDMNERIGDLSYKLLTNRENIKKSVLIKLLFQQYASEQDFLEDAHTINVQNLYPYFTICVLHCENRESVSLLYDYLNQRSFFPEQCFLLNSLETKQLVLIYNFPQKNGCFRDNIDALYQDIFYKLGKPVTIGVSNELQPFKQIPHLYEQAVSAINYGFVAGKHSIIYAANIDTAVKAITPLPAIDYVQLEKCILACDDALLIQIFYGIFEKLRTCGHTLNSIKIYLFDMFNRIRRMLIRLNISDYQIIDNELASIFMNADSLEELFNLLYTTLLEISKDLHTISDDYRIELIQQYIYGHLCDPDFNVNSISDYFHISLPTLSRFYKQKTGQNISTFINDLKIERTKELLIKSDHSIEYIVEKMGYSNTSSFIRKFKSIVGVTPGQYRQSYKEK